MFQSLLVGGGWAKCSVDERDDALECQHHFAEEPEVRDFASAD